MQISSFICSEIGKKKNYSSQNTKRIEALHSRFRQAWPSCLQFTRVSECKSKPKDMDMEFGASCAEGLWVCSRAQHCALTTLVTQGTGSGLWMTSHWKCGILCVACLSPWSWVPDPPVPPSASQCPFITTTTETRAARLCLPRALLISLLAVGFRHLR